MSVLIPGMDMPKNCHECDSWGLSDVVMIDCPVDKDGSLYSYTDRPDGCPLVPVPEHGDLIDRDKLEKDIDNYIGGEESRSRFHHWVQVQRSVIPKSEEAQT